MAASPLRRWLRRQPHPAKLRVDGRDVDVSTGANMWALTEETILSLNPSKVEALGPTGVVLRAMTLGEKDEDDAQGEDKEKPGASELVLLARLLAEAHDAGAKRHAEAYALAFTENTRLVQILAGRLSGLESAWQKAMQQVAQAHADSLAVQAQASEDPAGAAIATMLATGLMQQQPKPAPNGAAKPPVNGAKKGA